MTGRAAGAPAAALGLALAAALLAAPAAAQDADPAVRIVQPDAGATLNATDGGADVPVALQVENFELEADPVVDPIGAEDVPEDGEEPRVGHVHLSLVPRAEEEDVEAPAGAEEPPPGDQPREGAIPRNGTVPAAVLLEPASFARLVTTDVVVAGVPPGEYLLTARLVAPNEGGIQSDASVDSVPLTVVDGEAPEAAEEPEEPEMVPQPAAVAVAGLAAAAFVARAARRP